MALRVSDHAARQMEARKIPHAVAYLAIRRGELIREAGPRGRRLYLVTPEIARAYPRLTEWAFLKVVVSQSNWIVSAYVIGLPDRQSGD